MFADYMTNAWLGGTMVAIVAGVVGFFVVLRGASFAAHALPLSAFPGAAASNLLGIDPTIGLLAFSGLGVAGISRLSRRGHGDLATALTLVTLLGLGAFFLSRTTEYNQAVFALLFGEVLGIGNGDLLTIAATGTVCVAVIVTAFSPPAAQLRVARPVRSHGTLGDADEPSVPFRGGDGHDDGPAGGRRAARLQPDGPARPPRRAPSPRARCLPCFSRAPWPSRRYGPPSLCPSCRTCRSASSSEPSAPSPTARAASGSARPRGRRLLQTESRCATGRCGLKSAVRSLQKLLP